MSTPATKSETISRKLDSEAFSFDAAGETLLWGAAILRAASQTESDTDRALLVDAANYFAEWAAGAANKVTLREDGDEA